MQCSGSVTASAVAWGRARSGQVDHANWSTGPKWIDGKGEFPHFNTGSDEMMPMVDRADTINESDNTRMWR